MRAAVVVPSNRPERIAQFVQAWRGQFKHPDVRLIIVEDAPFAQTSVDDYSERYCWEDIQRDLGDKAECIPICSGGCRDYGFWLAGHDKSIDMIVSLDDDVLPIEGVDFLAEHWQALETPHSLKWWPLFPGFRLRGEPYNDAEVQTMLNLGLWHGFPDVDAYAQLCDPACDQTFGHYDAVLSPRLIPVGYYAPLCGMNVAFRREVAPYYYFPVLPDGYKRFDDIWCGLIFKRIADLFSWGVSYGQPALQHDRASVALNNLKQEMLGYGVHEEMWRLVDKLLSGIWLNRGPANGYNILAEGIECSFPQLRETARLMRVWASLWERADKQDGYQPTTYNAKGEVTGFSFSMPAPVSAERLAKERAEGLRLRGGSEHAV